MWDETKKWKPLSGWISKFNNDPEILASAIKEWSSWTEKEYHSAKNKQATEENLSNGELTELLILWCDTETNLDTQSFQDCVNYTQWIIGCIESGFDTPVSKGDYQRMEDSYWSSRSVLARLKLIVQLKYEQIDYGIAKSPSKKLTPSEEGVLKYVLEARKPLRQATVMLEMEELGICAADTARIALSNLRNRGLIDHNGKGFVPPTSR